MHLRFTNVNDAFYGLVEMFADDEWGETVRTTSRNGDVLQCVEPVTITYSNPRERVLFDAARDCNPFFHIFEAVWMLSGSDRVAPVAFFANNIRNYSDDGKVFNGAYGKRWRYAAMGNGGTLNQLKVLIKHFEKFPDSRRAVLSMWNVPQDLRKIDDQDGMYSKDVCCNLSVCFGMRNQPNKDTTDFPTKPCNNCGSMDRPQYQGTCNDDHCGEYDLGYCGPKYMDMTVFNRSNDLIWGAMGANVVHFSYLQEYMANCLGVEVGVYNQISNNLHVYTNNWQPEEWLKEKDHSDCYPQLVGVPPLVKDRIQFDKECKLITDLFDLIIVNFELLQVECAREARQLREPYLATVVMPMCQAFIAHKQRNYDSALFHVSQVASPDWKKAGTEWLERRKVNWQAKEKEGM